MQFPKVLQRLISELSKLPSIGEKTATRLACHLVQNQREVCLSLSECLKVAVESIRLCERCFYISEENLCPICKDMARDTSLLCVVEKTSDVMAVERLGEYKGCYHVLHGLWAPLKGQGPESMKFNELVIRLKEGSVKEVILATGCTLEGDATAMYVARVLSELGIHSTRLAQGMPKGGELEYADEVTLSRAFAGRTQLY